MQFSPASLLLEVFGGSKNLAKECLICGNLESLEEGTKTLEQFIEIKLVEQQFFVFLMTSGDHNDLIAASEAKSRALILPELGAIDFAFSGLGKSRSGHAGLDGTKCMYILYI